jgi:hypothetical protein
MEGETKAADARGQAQAEEIFVTVSDALEYLFFPRFIFFMHFSNPLGKNRTL